MMISFQTCTDLSKSAEITHRNMRFYYKKYSVDWDKTTIQDQIRELDNWDIIFSKEVVGALRLSVDKGVCYVRDLQVKDQFQNKGIGAKALLEAKVKSVNLGVYKLKLKVFRISPAHKLYIKNGFKIINEDERFYYMEHNLL